MDRGHPRAAAAHFTLLGPMRYNNAAKLQKNSAAPTPRVAKPGFGTPGSPTERDEPAILLHFPGFGLWPGGRRSYHGVHHPAGAAHPATGVRGQPVPGLLHRVRGDSGNRSGQPAFRDAGGPLSHPAAYPGGRISGGGLRLFLRRHLQPIPPGGGQVCSGVVRARPDPAWRLTCPPICPWIA